ncbi:substrate-binding domain-containing protein [Streptomyces sp. NPDC048566]|uniref:substrate-binding domain-containing protein n=1 Tax=Streptomyces sp. NPDC048566 TaxID=3365569 RepID=UPI0037113AFE
MGRHSLPDRPRAGAADPRARARRRTVAVAAVLVLTGAGGTAVAGRDGMLSLGHSCREDAVRLAVTASPDITPALTAAATYARDRGITSDGRCLDVRVSARDAYEVADALRAGRPGGTQVWVPDSGLWVQRVAASATATRVAGAGNVASTPVGVAMVPAAAKALGWPGKTYSWTQLAGEETQDDTRRLGAADPARSATALLALTRISAAASRTEDGGVRAAALAKSLSQRVSDSDAELLDTLPRDASGAEQGNPRRNQALVLSEQAAFAHNAAVGGGPGALDLFYPADGTPLLDYPYTLVDESALTTDQSRAALRFMTLLGEPAPQSILRRYGFRTEAQRPSAALVRAAGGRSPQPYTRTATGPESAAAVQEALGMWTITVQSARITTVVDASASMGEQVGDTGQTRMDVTKSSLLQALATFTPEDEIGVWTFATKLDGDRDYRVLVPTARLGTAQGGGTQRERLSAAFGSLKPVAGGATGLYDTTLAAYKAAVASYAKGRFNALVVLTDGANEDPGSISRSELLAALRKLADPERPVPLIAIAVGPDADRRELDRIARATGGSGQQVTDPAQIHAVMLRAIMAAGSGTPD